jgi:(1->4)-alpha-D-glucan 1-alpha-D-glucosylmutase
MVPTRLDDRAHVEAAVRGAARCRSEIDDELLRFLGSLALGEQAGAGPEEFAWRLQQLTPAVEAKGVEDTAFYRYNRLISLNEVGGDPGVFGRPPSHFHAATARSAERWPRTMLTLSTHDTKRSGDVRARLNVLSEVPEAWRDAVSRWAARGGGVPDRNAAYLFYQSLVGAWPLSADRAVNFMIKAAREARVHTSWLDPSEEYEAALERFVRDLLGDPGFTEDVRIFLTEQRVVERGRRNSIAQTTLLLTSPGVPDIYQGTELWDLSLVDPDNRRAVDFDVRSNLLRDRGLRSVAADLASDDVGASKLLLLRTLLAHRRTHGDGYSESDYESLPVFGPSAEAVVAYRRPSVIAVVPCRSQVSWENTSVELPEGRWRNLLTQQLADAGARPVEHLLSGLPVAVLSPEGD